MVALKFDIMVKFADFLFCSVLYSLFFSHREMYSSTSASNDGLCHHAAASSLKRKPLPSPASDEHGTLLYAIHPATCKFYSETYR